MLGKTTPPAGSDFKVGIDGAKQGGFRRSRARFSSLLRQTVTAGGHKGRPAESGGSLEPRLTGRNERFRQTLGDDRAAGVYLHAFGICHTPGGQEGSEPLVGLSAASADRWPEALSEFAAGLQAASLDTSQAITLRFHGDRIEGVLCQLTMEQGRVHCRLKAESASLRRELGARQKHLRQALRRHGLVLAKMEVSA